MRWQGWAVLVIVAAAVAFGIEAGEYGTSDWLELRRRERQEVAQVGRLQELVDSLERAAIALERDPRQQERVARESFGMIRQGEFLYKLVPAEP